MDRDDALGWRRRFGRASAGRHAADRDPHHPAPNSIIGRRVTFAASASDDHGVTRVEFWVDSARVATDMQAPYRARRTLDGLAAGTHTITARAFDTGGQAASAAETVTKLAGGARAVAASRRAASLAPAPAADGGTRLGRVAGPRLAVRVGLALCADPKGAVVARLRVQADGRGRIDAVLRVLRLDSPGAAK